MIGQSVDAQVAAHRGNPQALQQKYAASKDLIYLLALQKMKSEQEAAARQMQLAMSQQDAKSGVGEKTVAQQREEQVLESTKNDIAKQLGPTLANEQKEQQEAMRKLVQGIASAPGANSAMTPQAMAAGGIVGFNGTAGSAVPFPPRSAATPSGSNEEELKEIAEEVKKRRAREALQAASKAGPPAASAGRAGLSGVMQTLGRMPKPGLPGLGLTALLAGAPYLLNLLDGKGKDEGEKATPTLTPEMEQVMGSPRVPPTQGTPPPPPPPPRPRAAPAAPAAGGAVPSLTAPTIEKPDDYGLTEYGKQQMAIDPKAARAEEEARAKAAYGLSPEERAVLQRQMQDKYNPAKVRSEAITNFLIGAGGRTGIGSVLGGAGAAGTNYRREMEEGLKGAEQAMLNMDREARIKGYEGGIGELRRTDEARRSGANVLGNISQQESQRKTKQAEIEANTAKANAELINANLDREGRAAIAAMENRTRAALAAAQNEATEEARKSRAMLAFQKEHEDRQKFIERYSLPARAVIQLQEQKITLGKAFTPEQERMLLEKQKELDKLMEASHNQFTEQLRSYLPSSGGSGTVLGKSPSK
jgi:hypothetical protein